MFFSKRLGGYGLLGLFVCLCISWAYPAGAIDDWRQQPCVETLAQEKILSVEQVRYGAQPISQQQFAMAVLQAFPGRFARANETLGLTFDGDTETEQLLAAALDEAVAGRPIARSQALSVLTTGAALPYQPRAAQLLETTFRDSSLIAIDQREGVAAALALELIPAEKDAVKADGALWLNPNRSETYQMAANLLCAASPDPAVAALVAQRIQPAVTYSLRQDSNADYIATDICETAQKTTAEIWERGERLGTLSLAILGRHNLSNALAAIAVARRLGVEFDAIATIMATFAGAKRRFDQRGFHNNILFIDDYAHHPSEIKVTLAAAKVKSTEILPAVSQRRVVAVFQPHRYSRITTLLQEFATAFGDADQVIVTDIYSAGEANASGITGEDVTSTIGEHHTQATYGATLDDVKSKLASMLQPGDLVIFLTAGNLNQVIPDVMEYQANRAEQATLTSV